MSGSVAMSCFKYNGKAQQPEDEVRCHLLPYHLMDVAAVGSQVLDTHSTLLSDLALLLELSESEVKALLVFGLLMHDLGKMTASFQSIFADQNLCQIALLPGVSYDARSAGHDQLGYDVWQQLNLPAAWSQIGNAAKVRRLAGSFLGLFWGHHGRPVREEETMIDSSSLTEPDIEAGNEWLQLALSLLETNLPIEKFLDRDFRRNVQQASWLIAGFSTYCDWVGSDNSIFHYLDTVCPVEDYWQRVALPSAVLANTKTEVFDPVTVAPFEGFNQVFGFSPSPLQSAVSTMTLSQSPQLFIIEDLTGSGKTEAALTLTHRLLELGSANGFYMALPTMATSNAMFSRTREHYSKMFRRADGSPLSIVLAHGSRALNEEFQEARLGNGSREMPYKGPDETASLHCSEWLADSRKKALLAPVGVGTIDQVLLSVLPKKHQSLRVLGMYRKILVIDEVHAADTYMFKLLDSVLKLHASQGGSVIMLTATLSLKQRTDIVESWQSALGLSTPAIVPPASSHFPLLTRVSQEAGVEETPLMARPGTEKTVAVEFVHSAEACVERIAHAAKAGQCVVWVRNSVDEVIDAYQQVCERLGESEQVLLFHSRFTLADRIEKEQWVKTHLGKHSTAAERAGRVLVASQVFQESLDADADLMISDLCLIDDLVQRAGRLHRHVRDNQGNPLAANDNDRRAAPTLLVHAPEWQETPDEAWLKRHSRNTQYVYQTPGKIWLTMAYLKQKSIIELPQSAREMIEFVYGDNVAIPEAFANAEQEFDGKERAARSQGQSNVLNLSTGYSTKSSQVWSDDNVEVGTRLGEEAFEVLLVEKVDGVYQPAVQAAKNAIELSTVKLSSQKLLKLLVEFEEAEKAHLVALYPRAKYMKVAPLEGQQELTYSSRLGLSRAHESFK